jgi:methylated-DNA-[protein]-cysteine S-methyltransferase
MKMEPNMHPGWVQWTLTTPFGNLTVHTVYAGLCGIRWGEMTHGVFHYRGGRPFNFTDEGPVILESNRSQSPDELDVAVQYAETAIHQLRDYFEGRRRSFSLPLVHQGTDFRNDVWKALGTIPYGKTCSYKDIAAAIGRPLAVRAVGQANRHNPYPIIVPCHRVMGADGRAVGYNGNHVDLKMALIDLEREFIHQEIMATKYAEA